MQEYVIFYIKIYCRLRQKKVIFELYDSYIKTVFFELMKCQPVNQNMLNTGVDDACFECLN